nr:transposase [Bacillus mycoides]
METHKPVALLPDRRSESVSTWLKEHPHIEVVSRDGFSGYRQGIADANISIKQVYDRWHLIKNAKDQLDRYLTISIPARIAWEPQKNLQIQEMKPIEVTTTKSEKEKHAREMKKWEFIKKIKTAYQSGNSILSLSKFFNLDRRTIGKYIRLTTPPSFSRHRVSPIDSY